MNGYTYGQVLHQLTVMNKNAKQLQSLINELLELRNMKLSTDKSNITRNDAVGFVKGVMLQFEDLADRHAVHFRLDTSEEIISLSFDREMMEKILINIFSNAFKFTPMGGKILISIKPCSEDDSDYICIKISDNGKGIPEKDLPYIFERFYQGETPLHQIQKGSGLGLSLVKDLMEFHSGKVEVTSEPDQGTSILLFFPYDENEQIESIIVQSDQGGGSLPDESEEGKEKLPLVLLVEDNHDVLDFLRTSLEDEFTILIANNGQEGYEIAIKQIPDFIISDIMMPVMDGIELCRKVKSDTKTSHIPLLLLTARSGEESHIQGLDIGADDYIPKPFNVKILRARINNIIATRKKLHAIFSSGKTININEVVTNDRDKIFLEKLDAIINQNIKNPDLNHELLGREIGMSKTQLYRKLQAITGATVHEYIRNYRLRKAYEMIKQKPDLLIYEIAYEIGFKDHAYFSKSFYAYFNIWPKELKRDLINL